MSSFHPVLLNAGSKSGPTQNKFMDEKRLAGPGGEVPQGFRAAPSVTRACPARWRTASTTASGDQSEYRGGYCSQSCGSLVGTMHQIRLDLLPGLVGGLGQIGRQIWGRACSDRGTVQPAAGRRTRRWRPSHEGRSAGAVGVSVICEDGSSANQRARSPRCGPRLFT